MEEVDTGVSPSAVQGSGHSHNFVGVSKLKRASQMLAGIVLILVGIILSGPGIPGPGLLFIVVGLNLVKPNNFIYRWVRRKAPGVPDEGPIPKNQMIAYSILTIAFVVVSLLYGRRMLEWALEVFGLSLPF